MQKADNGAVDRVSGLRKLVTSEGDFKSLLPLGDDCGCVSGGSGFLRQSGYGIEELLLCCRIVQGIEAGTLHHRCRDEVEPCLVQLDETAALCLYRPSAAGLGAFAIYYGCGCVVEA